MKPFDLQHYLGNGPSVVSNRCNGSADREKIAPRQTWRYKPDQLYNTCLLGNFGQRSAGNRTVVNRKRVGVNASMLGYRLLPRCCIAGLLTAVTVVTSIALMPGYAAAEATVVESVRSDNRDLHLVVKPGETLNAILLRELETVEDWKLVARTNKIAEPDKLRPGDVIVIPASLVQKRNYARLAFAKGTAELIRAITQSVEKIKKGLKVFVGDAIKTGNDGFVSLTFRDQSQVNILPNSAVVVEKLECFDKTVSCVIGLRSTEGELNLDVGGLEFELPTRFTIETPYASAVVRGTQFDFDIRDGNILGVTEGEVEISIAGQSARVPVGKGTLAGEGRSIATQYDLLPAAQFPEFVDFNRVSAEDLLQWNAVEDAERYLVTIATDEAMTNVVTTSANSASEQGATVVFSEVQPGDYFIGVRAVDQNGLRGFAATRKLQQVSIDKEIGPELNIEIIGNEMEIRSESERPLEIRVGNELQFAEGLDRLLQYQTYQLQPGNSLELDVGDSPNWYLVAREILSENSVSSYSGLYEYKAER